MLNFEIDYNEDIGDDYIGKLMYSAINNYVTNLLASKKEGTKKPTAKK